MTKAQKKRAILIKSIKKEIEKSDFMTNLKTSIHVISYSERQNNNAMNNLKVR